MVIFIHVFFTRDCFMDITIHIKHFLLHIHGSYPEIEPQTKQILLNIYMTIILKKQSKGHK